MKKNILYISIHIPLLSLILITSVLFTACYQYPEIDDSAYENYRRVIGPDGGTIKFLRNYENDSIIDQNNVHTYFLNEQLMTNVSNDLKPVKIQLFDVLGKEVLNVNFKKKVSTINIEHGIYIIKYNFDDAKTVSKKVIKR